MVHSVNFPPNQFFFCTVSMTFLFIAFLCSTLFVLSLTFDRFYSILVPHKAASVNTTKRAKLTIFGIVVFSSLYNVPHLFVSDHEDWQCLPYGTAMDKPLGQFYYWLSFIVNFALPFVLLLTMNSVIIYKLRKRNEVDLGENVGHNNQGQCAKGKRSEVQTYAILFLVTFAFLLLTTPAYLFFFIHNGGGFFQDT